MHIPKTVTGYISVPTFAARSGGSILTAVLIHSSKHERITGLCIKIPDSHK